MSNLPVDINLNRTSSIDQLTFLIFSYRLVTISQGTARNQFWEAGMLMQSSILDIVQLPLLNNICPVYTPANGLYANYRGQRSSSAFFFYFKS